MADKARLGVFGMTSCYGCQLQILNLEEKILPLLNFLDISYWRLVQETPSDPTNLDIAIIEGSATNEEEIAEVKEIRKNAKAVITIGACAHLGGVQGLRNIMDDQDVQISQYGEGNLGGVRATKVHAIEEIIDVDYAIRGCPIDKTEFANAVLSLLTGRTPHIWNSTVCNECKNKGNICFFEHQDSDSFCLGPITEAGCGARCPSNNRACDGCRGWTTDPHVVQQIKELSSRGLNMEEIVQLVRRYSGGQSKQDEVIKELI